MKQRKSIISHSHWQVSLRGISNVLVHLFEHSCSNSNLVVRCDFFVGYLSSFSEEEDGLVKRIEEVVEIHDDIYGYVIFSVMIQINIIFFFSKSVVYLY